MAVDFIFVSSILFFMLMLIGFYVKEYLLIVATSFGIMTNGVYILINGTVGIQNVVTLTIGTIFVCYGFYVLVRSILEQTIEIGG